MIVQLPEGWTADGWHFWEDYADEGEFPEDHPGLWHVTTAIRGVTERGQLLSRAQLQQDARLVGGLGGGIWNQAPDKVSMTTRPEYALQLWRMMSLAALAANNRIPAWRVLWEVSSASSWADILEEVAVHWEMLDTAEQEELDINEQHFRQALVNLWGGGRPGDPTFQRDGAPRTQGHARARARVLEAQHPTGEAKYNLLQDFEQLEVDLASLVPERDDEAFHLSTGFTAPWSAWRAVDPRSVRVLRLAARKDARTDPVPTENELRMDPKDVRIIGVESYRGLVQLIEADKRLHLGRVNRRR